jgi:hypothetical protein
MTVEQTHFEWAEPIERSEPSEVVLEPETVEALIPMMARALIAVVRPAEEATDDR